MPSKPVLGQSMSIRHVGRLPAQQPQIVSAGDERGGMPPRGTIPKRGARAAIGAAAFALAGALAAALPTRGFAQESGRVAPPPAAGVCEMAAGAAEQQYGLPAGLLRAIGIVESGRWQPAINRVAPWPYAIDVGGYDLFMESLPEAVGKVASLRQEGFASIDVGCFQINLMYHPDAFATLEEAFDPAANAAYAARFLLSLYGRSGSWEIAVADYHSAVPELGDPYRAHVYAVWQGAPPGAVMGTGYGTGSGRGAVSVALGAPHSLDSSSPGVSWGGWTSVQGNGFVRLAAFRSPAVLWPSVAPSSASGQAARGQAATWQPGRPLSGPVPVFVPGLAASRPTEAAPPPGQAAASTRASLRRVTAVHAGRRGLPVVFTPSGG